MTICSTWHYGVLKTCREDTSDSARAYLVCGLLDWITRADPHCGRAAAAFRKATEHCPDFVAEDQPDFTIRTGTTWTEEMSPQRQRSCYKNDRTSLLIISLLLAATSSAAPTRHGLLSKVSLAVKTRFEWGMKLALALQEKDLWETDVWRPILGGWSAATLTEEEFIRVLSFIAESNLFEFFDNYVEELLLVKAESNDFQGRYSWVPFAEEVTLQLWFSATKKNQSHSELEDQSPVVDDWTFVALNHAGGKLVQAIMYLLSARRREAGADWNQLPDKYKTLLDQILTQTNRPAQWGRVFLAYNIPFLMNIDTDWTRKSVLPLLDSSKDQMTAEQAWHGYLGMGRLPRQLLPELLPFYEKTFPRVSTNLGSFREDFLRQMAELCFIRDFDPLKEEWLQGFLSALDEQDRARWSFWVCKFLASSSDDLKRTCLEALDEGVLAQP